MPKPVSYSESNYRTLAKLVEGNEKPRSSSFHLNGKCIALPAFGPAPHGRQARYDHSHLLESRPGSCEALISSLSLLSFSKDPEIQIYRLKTT